MSDLSVVGWADRVACRIAAARPGGLRPCYDRPAMPDLDRPAEPGRPAADPDRFYVTTAIAYANNKPGLHTLYEVIAADALARWHRMRGIADALPDRHRRAQRQHRPGGGGGGADAPRLRRREGRPLPGRRGRPADRPDRFIRTTDPDHLRSAQEMVRRAYANGDIYVGTYEGWYCPNEGFRNATDVHETAAGTICPNHPEVPLQWLTEKNWFFRLSAYQERLERWFEEHPRLRPARLPAQRDARLHPRRPRGLLDQPRAARGGGSRSRSLRRRLDAHWRDDGTWDPDAGTIYVWYDALINYITGAGFPDDPEPSSAGGRPTCT